MKKLLLLSVVLIMFCFIATEVFADPTGACCTDGGMRCSNDVDEAACIDTGGDWRGPDSNCGVFDEATGLVRLYRWIYLRVPPR